MIEEKDKPDNQTYLKIHMRYYVVDIEIAVTEKDVTVIMYDWCLVL
jgi:hypothetical protein